MRILFLIIIAGIIEILIISKLHEYLGLKNLILFYLSTTFFGVIIAWLFYSEYKNKKSISHLGSGFDKRIKNNKVSEEDQRKFNLGIYCFAYVLGCILIAIPGILTDVLGMLLLLPPMRTYLANRYGNKTFSKFTSMQSKSSNK